MPPSALCLAAILCVAASPLAVARTDFVAHGLTCRAWQLDDGLPDNSVASLLQTRDGFLWLGTYDGFVRFDGRHFTTLPLPGDKSLLSEGILQLHEDRRGQLWGLTDRGRVFTVIGGAVTLLAADARFAGQNVSIHEDRRGDLWIAHATGLLGRVTGTGAFTLVRNDVAASAVDANGALWVLSKEGKLFQQSESGWTRLPDAGGFTNDDCRALASGSDDQIVVARGNQLWRLTGTAPLLLGSGPDFGGINAIYPTSGGALWTRRGTAFRLFDSARKWSSPPVETDIAWVQSARAARDDALWIGEMGGGVTMLSATGEKRRYRSGDGLGSNRVSSLEIDREGSVWIGFFDGGLQQARRSFFEGVRTGAPLVPTSVTEDGRGGVWIAGHGGALARWDGTRCIPATFAGATLPVQTRVVLSDRRDQLWAGTFNQGLWRGGLDGLHRYLTNEPALRDPRALFEDSRGRLWVGSHAGAFYLHDDVLHAAVVPGMPQQPTTCAFAESRTGEVWIATEGAGVVRWRNGEVSAPPELQALASATVSLLFFDGEDALWIATREAGLLRWKGGVVTRLTQAHGLPGEQLLAMCDDRAGHFWFTSRHGILRIAKAELQACAEGRLERVRTLQFDRSDGLPTAQCVGGLQPSLWQARGGRIWVPTSREAVSFDPRNVRPNEQPPLLIVGNFLADGKAVPVAGSPVHLGPGTERIEFRFTALSFAAPERVRHAHRLVGLSNDWFDSGADPHIIYGNLRPGKYRLEIAAANEHGVWSAPQTAAAFEVLPHLWQNPWLQCLALVGAITVSGAAGQRVMARRWRRRLQEAQHQHALERERARIARDIHDELGASLTRITLLSQHSCPTGPVQRVLEEIESTARDVTRAMDELVWAVNPHHDTVEGLITYLQRFAQRFLAVAGIRCRFDLPLEADARPLSGDVRHQIFLAYKECLHNVVRHARASEVQVRVISECDRLLLEVMDNGCGLDSRPAEGADTDRCMGGHGLRGMSDRLVQVGGRCEVLPRMEGGTVVCFTLSLPPVSESQASQ